MMHTKLLILPLVIRERNKSLLVRKAFLLLTAAVCLPLLALYSRKQTQSLFIIFVIDLVHMDSFFRPRLQWYRAEPDDSNTRVV